ncbi:hypothetical protein P280DRAFT_156710 [Massarina eburnea CBS 473.64]|uniref:Uncharacterized protein n=1 Tax=Massarina eburnea CBS 473.64 TaxID=1395130 RepID=A0A6A6RQR5_9PLEO|nr:hypothetical protein P280DRAFT_156710 [Massarina eburnea CBS 473.64]
MLGLYLPSAVRNDHPGMRQSRQGHMRSPFIQNNISSSSLEGMERPIRSFKSFIKTVPPHPQAVEKPLPPTPPPKLSPSKTTPSPPRSTPSPTSPVGRDSSVASWRAPVDWFQDTSTPPALATRTYSPLLPDPSPNINMEPTSYLGETSRLVPIYERPQSYTDLGPPPRSPPRTPLPAPPPWTLNGRTKENPLASADNSRSSSSAGPVGSKVLYESDLRYRTASPSDSNHTSVTSNASTKEKAFSSLGIGSPRQKTAILEDRPYDPESTSPMERTRADRQYLRGKKLRSLNKGNPLADDSWEDTEMDDKTRMLSFAQDYHDLLVDQYQEMNVRPAEVSRSGGPHQVSEAQLERPSQNPRTPPPPKDHDELYPQPLSWSKNSNASSPAGSPQHPSSPRTRSQENVNDNSPSSGTKESKHKRITSWVPHRLSVVQARRRSSAESRSTAKRQKQIPDAEVDKVLKEDLRFSMFFPPSKSLKFLKKSKDHNITPPSKAPPLATSPGQSTTPLIRLPGGLAVVRHTPSPSAAPKSETASVTETSPISPSSSHPSSDFSPRSENRSSFNSRHSNPVNPGIAVRSTYRTSAGSSYSKRSSASQTPHPLATEMSVTQQPTQTPPPPPIPSSSVSSPPLSPDAWKRLKNHTGVDLHAYKSGFVEKAREARRRHHKEARQERLKRSIKVLGPTDPGVVSGYVKREVARREDSDEGRADSDVEGSVSGRLPGYLVASKI